MCTLRCRIPQWNQLLQPSRSTHLSLWKWSLSAVQRCCAFHCSNHHICDGICCWIQTCCLIHHGTWDNSSPPNPYWHGMAPTQKSIQTDNSTAAGVTTNTIVPCWSKMMDMRFWWLRCQESQDQFCYYWDAGSKNWADYNTKHHPDSYHEAHCSTHAGIWDQVDTWLWSYITKPLVLGFPI